MAAGKGTRMHPYSLTIPKPLMPGVGRSLLQHQIEFLRPKTKKIIVTVGYMGEVVKDAAYIIGADEVIDIGNRGNAYWLNNAKMQSISEPVIVLTSDNLMEVNLDHLELESGNNSGGGLIVAIKSQTVVAGNFIQHNEGRITSMRSKEKLGSLLASGLQTIVPADIPLRRGLITDFEEVWDSLIENSALRLSELVPSQWRAIDTFEELQIAISQGII